MHSYILLTLSFPSISYVPFQGSEADPAPPVEITHHLYLFFALKLNNYNLYKLGRIMAAVSPLQFEFVYRLKSCELSAVANGYAVI